MLNIDQATEIVTKAIPGGKIQANIFYKGFYVFQVFTDDLDEGEWDPFYSVNQSTGEFSDFDIFTDGNASEISTLFLEAKQNR